MPYITPAATHFITVNRRGNILLSSTDAAASLTLDNQPGIKSIIQVVVDFSYDRYYIVNNNGTPAPDTPTKGASSLVTSNNTIENQIDKAPN